jgi:predicted regulator of Ras-like GTPase activity (Roadblock/LC7/MglB family)
MTRKPLVLTEESMAQINKVLMNLLKQSDAKCAILVDQDGKCIAKKGFTKTIDTDSLSALIAGAFSSTRAMAKLVGEKDFSVLFHQGDKDHIHNILVDDDTILTVIFDDRTTIGMVRLYSKESAQGLREVLKQMRASVKKDKGVDIVKEASDRLDDLFGA